MFSLRRAALTVDFRASAEKTQSLDPFNGKDINLHQNSDSIFDMVTFFFFFFPFHFGASHTENTDGGK